MTIKELSDLLARREAALTAIEHDRRELGHMPPEDRERIDRASVAICNTEGAIVAELRRHDGPIRIGDAELHLTRDGRGFAMVDPATGRIHDNEWASGPPGYPQRQLLYRYPARPA